MDLQLPYAERFAKASRRFQLTRGSFGALGLCCGVALLLGWELAGQNLNYGDLRAFTIAWFPPSRYWSAWQVEGLGNYESRPPIELLISLVVGKVGPASSNVFQEFLLLAPYPGSCLAMWRFLRIFKMRGPERAFGSVFYAFNPLTLQEVVGGAIGLHWTYAFTPVAGLLIFKIGKRADPYDGLKLGVTLSIASIFLPHAAIFALAVPMIASVVPTLVGMSTRNHLFKVGISLGLAAALYFLLLLPSILPLALLSSAASFASSALPNLGYTYAASNPINTIRLLGVAWEGTPLWRLGYLDFTIQGLATFLFPLLILITVASMARQWSKSLGKRIILSFAAWGLAIICFDFLVMEGLFYSLFLSFPTLFEFESPVKLSYGLAFLLAPILALGAGKIRNRIDGYGKPSALHLKRVLVTLLLLGPLAVGLTPFSHIDSVIAGQNPAGYALSARFVQMGELLDTLRHSEGYFRTLWIPLDYSMFLQASSVDPLAFGIPGGGELRGVFGAISYVDNTLSYLAKNDTTNAGRALGFANVKYILVDLQSTQRENVASNGYYLRGNPLEFKSILDKSASFVFVESINGFLLYRNLAFLPHVLVIQGAHSIDNLTTIFEGNATITVPNVTALDPTHYKVGFSSPASGILVLGEAFNVAWVLSMGSNDTSSTRAIWANSFLLNVGVSTLEITFQGQSSRTLTLAIQATVVASIGLVPLVRYRLFSKREYSQEEQG